MILGRVSSLGFFCHLILIIFGFQVQSKLGLSGASKSLPKVLEMAGVKKNVFLGKGQMGLALDVHGLVCSDGVTSPAQLGFERVGSVMSEEPGDQNAPVSEPIQRTQHGDDLARVFKPRD
jgi:hypothetical protein